MFVDPTQLTGRIFLLLGINILKEYDTLIKLIVNQIVQLRNFKT
jgi:hypothetical protein